MVILGIDPGTAITGFGVLDFVTKTNNAKMLSAGVIRTPPKQALEQRLLTIFNELDQIIKEYSPEEIAVEHIYFAKNVTTGISVSHARGVILLLAAQHKLKLAEYTPLQIKQAVTGYGRAEKKQMQEMVKTLLKLRNIPKPDDAADALAVAICHGAILNP